jgi:osmotically inducible protein OsmC
MDIIYKTTMLTQGGRGGQIQSDDGSFKLKLAVPESMGGKGGGPTPEQLFAGAYAACLEHSVRHIARMDKLPLKGSYVEADLSLYVTDEHRYRVGPSFTVHMAGDMDQPTADSLLQRAHGICPYADATKNNLSVKLTAVVDRPA